MDRFNLILRLRDISQESNYLERNSKITRLVTEIKQLPFLERLNLIGYLKENRNHIRLQLDDHIDIVDDIIDRLDND